MHKQNSRLIILINIKSEWENKMQTINYSLSYTFI